LDRVADRHSFALVDQAQFTFVGMTAMCQKRL
jgi:hypothetical protein